MVILMKKRFVFLLLVACIAAKAQTIQVSGEQSGVWDADTVLVTGDVMVMDSLQIAPGTVVLFDGFYNIAVGKGASFEAIGTESDSISFTIADTTGFHIYYSGKGGWNGFRVDRAGHFLMDYCVLEYSKAFINKVCNGGAMDFDNCEDVHVYHSTFHHNAANKRGGAVNGMESQVEMKGCSFHHNTVYDSIDLYLYGGAASFLNCDVEMREMEFRENDGSYCVGGALSFDSCSVVLDRSVFVKNIGVNGGGFYLMRSFEKECRLSNLLFDDNYTLHFGGGFAVSDASPEINNVLVVNNSSYGVSCNGIFYYGHCGAKLNNCIVYGNYAPEPEVVVDTAQMWLWTTDDYAPEFRNCLIEGGQRFIHSADYIKVWENNIDADPMFVDMENHDFRLAEGSPCIDAGNLQTPQYVLDGLDLNGIGRVKNNRIDIGPYEFSGAYVAEANVSSFAKLTGNPLGKHSRIEFDEDLEGEVMMTVYSLTGRLAVQKAYESVSARSIAIGELVGSLVPGVYLIEVVNKGRSCTLKAVK